MKKALLFGIFIMMYAGLLAQKSTSAGGTDNAAPYETHVTLAQALNVGYTFMHTSNGTKSGTVSKQAMQLVYTGQAFDNLTGTTTDCYYVFALQPKGFVIVAADDRVEPILGYSYDNDFAVADMPDHVRSWLNGYERQIETVAKNNFQPAPETQTKWTRLKSGQAMNSAKSDTSVGPLLTTTWDQGQYYNNLCPASAGGPDGHALTGCVATAMAQIIHYWGYPAHGRGTHSYSSDYGTLTVNYDSTNYNYTLMPDALTTASTTDEVNAVAGLIRDCGVAVNMRYSPTESRSNDPDARAALINFYRFSPNLSFAEKENFPDSEWDAMLHADLDNNRPVYYSGWGNGSHAFVCDGYDADGYYHFNFGWSGWYDGWFLTNSITPIGSNFSSGQEALFGIVPDSTGNVIIGQMSGTSTFTVDEPLEFYHLMGHNAYVVNHSNLCNNTIHFIPADTTNQIVADILDFEDQTLTFSDGNGNPLRNLAGGNTNDSSPVVSSHNALNIAYSGSMYNYGFKVGISQTDSAGCRMVSNITAFADTSAVYLTWAENGNATQWEVEYGIKGFTLGTGTIYTATTTTAAFHNLQPVTEYDFYIRAVCDSTHHGQWNKTTLMMGGPYWQDIVTSQPAGYVYNAETNSVDISTAEQLAWWAKTGDGINGHLAADIDLSGHRWQPTALSGRNFNGHGHVITNLYVINDGGFFSACAEGCIIENVGLTNAFVKSNSQGGGLCGTLRGTMRNCYVTNSLIQVKNDANLLESYAGGLVCFNTGLIINCYVNAEVRSYFQGGLLACYSYGTIQNCYVTGKLPILSWCYYGSIAAVANGEISHCYSEDAYPVGFVTSIVGLPTITDVSLFKKSGNGWSLLTPIVFEDVIENDLLSALNRGMEMYNDSAYCTWTADTGNGNGGFPVFGDHFVVQCPNVTDVSIHNIIVDNQYAVTIGWTENGDASQWLIRYRDHDRPDTAYSYVMATSNPDTLFGIPLGHEYDFNVRAICDTDLRSGWGETRSEIIDLTYWTDIVTTKPDGYVEDTDGNVEIYSTEGLAWISVITNGLHNQPQNSFTGKTVTLKSDINLEGYRWYPIGGFAGTFDGQNHLISNIYMNSETGGVFGSVGDWNGVVVVKNVILEGGSITCGRGYGGGLIGLALYNCEISNCHVSTTIHSRYSVPTGALCGEIQTGTGITTTPTISVSNCSASSTVYGGARCGNLIGYVLGNVDVRNCYATGDVYPANEISGNVYCRGAMIGDFEGNMVNNCFSTGMVYNCLSSEMNMSNSGCYGKVIGCLSSTDIHHLYGQNNVNAGLAEYGLDGIADNSLFTHSGNANTLLNPVSIDGTNYSDLLDALNAWVALQNDTALRTWALDTLSGYPVFGDFFVPVCYAPADLTVSQASAVGNPTIKTRLSWTQKGEPDHWEVLYVASSKSMESGTIIPVNNNHCVLAGIPVGEALDFYVRAVCGDADTSTWCGPVTYLPDKLRWTEVVTSQPEGYTKGSDGNLYISSAEGLAWVSSVINRLNGNNSYYWFGDIILTEDIDMSAYRWTTIGNSWETACYHSFNGNNHVVSGLYCNELSAYQGFFGIMQRNIQNLTLSQCDIHGLYETGALAGHCNDVNIRNCIVNGKVSGPNSSMLIGASYSGTIENSCFISKDNKHGNPAATGGGSNDIVNFYVGDSDSSATSNHYYNSSTYFGDFSGNGYSWTLNSPLYINGAFHSDLLDALNTWVDANNINGQYRRWVADTAMVNGGYPVFEAVSNPAALPTVTTDSVSYITDVSSRCGGNVTSDGDAMVFKRGVCWSTSANPTIADAHTTDGASTGAFTSAITELTPNTTYYVRAYASNSAGTAYGEEVTFTTTEASTPTTISCGYKLVVGDYSYTTQQYGSQCWMTQNLRSPNGNYFDYPDVLQACPPGWHLPNDNDWGNLGNHLPSSPVYFGDGDYWTSTFIPWPNAENHQYSLIAPPYVHSNIVSSSDGIKCEVHDAAQCNCLVHTCLSVRCVRDDTTATPPLVTTGTISDITVTTASCGGNIISDGGATVTERGVCWSTSANPTVADTHTNDSTGTGAFTGHLTGLEPGTTYYVRAYATNSVGTTYGEVVTFTSGCNPVDVTITSDKVAICKGECATLHAHGTHLYIWNTGENSSSITDCPSVTTTYSVTGFDLYGCAFAASFTLTVNDRPATPVVTVENATICDGGQVTLTVSNPGGDATYTWYRNGTLMEEATQATLTDTPATVGNYVYTVAAVANTSECVSGTSEPIVVTMGSTSHTELFEVSCNSYVWNDETYTVSGDYTRTFTSVSGCDSMVTLHLTVNHLIAELVEATACDSYTWNDSVYTQSGNYTQTFTATNGCDSIVTLILTLIFAETTEFSETVCDSYTWNDSVYTQSGDYTQTFTAANGCDSVVTLHLTVKHSVTELVEATACNSYTWNDSVYTQSGDYTQTFTAANGCDSIVTLALTLNFTETAEFAETACFSFTWNGETYTTSGNYTQTFTNASGCDSVVTLHLTVNHNVTPPAVTTDTASDITTFTGTCGGDVTDDGGADVTERGVCWSTAPAPTIDGNHTTDSSGTGAFTSSITGLIPNTTYYVRAYATNCAGTAYGEELMFTTLSVFTCGDSLIHGGNIYTSLLYGSQCWMTRNLRNASGGEGFTWSAAMQSCPVGWHLPTPGEWIALANYVNNNTQDSNIPLFFAKPGIGRFWEAYSMNWDLGDGNLWTLASVSHFSGQQIQPGTQYYQYYDVNENYISVRCLRDENASATLPLITTDTVINITATSATCIGNVSNDGGTNVTERGFCWRASQNPVVTVSGAGPGTFSANLSYLTPNTTFHVRAYATNSAGTVYGEEMTFTTGCIPADISITSDKVAICKGECATLHAFGADNYVWNTGENGSSITDCPAVTTTYSVTSSDLYGCESAASFTLLVNDLPATPVVTADNDTVCNGGALTLTVTYPDFNPSTSYTWYRDGVVISDATQAVIVDYPTTVDNEITNHIYTAVASHDNSGCVSGISDSTTVTVVTNKTEQFETACDSYTWNDSVYTLSGDYTQTFTAANGCDSVVTLHLTINQSVAELVEATECDSYIWNDSVYTQSGDYTQTFTNANGCDSVVTLHLTVNHDNTGDTTAVTDDRFDWYEHTYLTLSGDYTHVFTNQSGCDSVVTLHLTVSNPTITIQDTVMTNGYFIWHGMVFTSDTVLTETIPVLDGYDSVIIYHVFVTPTPLTVLTVDTCVNYTLNGQTYNETGDYVQTFPISSGIDSVVVLYLTIFPADSTDFAETACESFTWEGTTYTTSGDYTQIFTNVNSCDSVVTLHLTLFPADSADFTETACEFFTWEGTTYTTSGDYTQIFSNVNGCDSVVTLHLTLFPADSADFAETACESFTWEGTTYTISGDYTQIFTNVNGCDSVVTLHLTLFPADSTDFAETACEFFTWEGTTYTTSGDYTKTFSNANDCDSVVTLHLTLFPADSTDFTETACDFFTWEGTTYTASGDYTKTFSNVNGCDSVVTLHLTVFPADSADLAETACEFFTWEGTTYTTSGDYTQIFTNVNGCDSVVTLHLTIFPADSADFAETACEFFTWEGTTYTASGDYTQIFTNVNGCDSVVTLHLTLFPADSTDFAETACEFFTWDGTTYTTSGDYTKTFSNANGCDSVVTLHLTIFPADSTDFTETACEFFTWEGTTYTTSGDYTKSFTNANGCDSVVTLHLTVNYSNSGDTTAVACDSFDWYEQTNLTQSGDYTRTITNAAGCDSVVTLHLTVNATEASEFAVETSDSCYNWNSETYCTSGDYTQTLQTIDGCDSVVTLHLTVSVGIDDHNDFAFNLYPNPTNGIVIIQFTHHNSPITHIHVFDAYGKLVGVVETNAHDSSVQTAQIDLSGFAAGVYFMKAVADGNVVTVRKVVKR